MSAADCPCRGNRAGGNYGFLTEITTGKPANTFAPNMKSMKAIASGIHISRLVALKKIERRATQIIKPTVLQMDAELSESSAWGEG